MNCHHIRFQSIYLAVLLALLFAPMAVADEARPHNQAEGDNPQLDEAALQGIKTKPAEAAAGGSTEQAQAKTPDWNKLEPVVEKLVLEYYPKAKIKKGKDQLHVEFKARPYDIPSTNKTELGPDWSGLVFDMDLKQGPYAGVHAVPKKFNEYSFYVVELYAPYSKQYDRHLLTRICYPFDVPQEFLKRFKKLVDDFDQFL